MSYIKITTTTYVVAIEIRQGLPDYLIEGIKSLLASDYDSPRVKAIKYLREKVRDLCGHPLSLRDAKDIIEDIRASMPKPEEALTLGDILAQALKS